MISISCASSSEDFETAAGLCHALGEWDVIAVQPYGVSREEVLAQFHTETSSSLAAKYNAADAKILIARWETAPAGCPAFVPFDDEAMEFHKFFVDSRFRGKGIGRELMRSALAEVAGGRRRKILLHTTPYMKDAISVYESFGFTPCPRFRPTPDWVSHTDLFMSRTI
jgi:GNAT superfamily N-acetyltransferase